DRWLVAEAERRRVEGGDTHEVDREEGDQQDQRQQHPAEAAHDQLLGAIAERRAARRRPDRPLADRCGGHTTSSRRLTKRPSSTISTTRIGSIITDTATPLPSS